jgi:hypothetical protein
VTLWNQPALQHRQRAASTEHGIRQSAPRFDGRANWGCSAQWSRWLVGPCTRPATLQVLKHSTQEPRREVGQAPRNHARGACHLRDVRFRGQPPPLPPATHLTAKCCGAPPQPRHRMLVHRAGVVQRMSAVLPRALSLPASGSSAKPPGCVMGPPNSASAQGAAGAHRSIVHRCLECAITARALRRHCGAQRTPVGCRVVPFWGVGVRGGAGPHAQGSVRVAYRACRARTRCHWGGAVGVAA